MAYRIEYEPVIKTNQTTNILPFRATLLTLTVFAAFMVTVHSCFPSGWELIQDLIWPGDAQTTQQALELFVDDLRTGETFSTAAEAFCREILTDADIP